MKVIKKTLILTLVLVANAAYAQCDENTENGWRWGCDPDKAKEKNALYTDAYKSENFKEAAKHLEWLLENTPNLNKSIYINGAKIYEALANMASDKDKKAKYIDKTMEMFDKRIEYFNDEADVLNRQAYTAYKLMKKNASRYQYLMDLYAKALEKNGDRFYNNNLVGYLDVIRRYKAVGNEVKDDFVFEKYFAITGIIEYKESQGRKVNKSIVDTVDKLLLMIVPNIDCEVVINDFGPKLEANPDVKMAKKIFQLMLTGKCTEDPLALKAAKMIDEKEPSYGIKKFIASHSIANGDKETAIKYFNDALELTDENIKKSDIYMRLAQIKASQGLKSSARSFAYKALDADPTAKEAYEVIGNLYMNSFEDCAGKDDIVKDRAVFIAAYDMYRKAGSSAGMARAKSQFPSRSEIFEGGYSLGQQIKVNCWINTTVSLEQRPNN